MMTNFSFAQENLIKKWREILCDSCNGKGKLRVVKKECPVCKGKGKFTIWI